MKVAIVADTHGGFKPLVDLYKDKIAEVNLVCILGDMYRSEVQLLVDFGTLSTVGQLASLDIDMSKKIIVGCT